MNKKEDGVTTGVLTTVFARDESISLLSIDEDSKQKIVLQHISCFLVHFKTLTY